MSELKNENMGWVCDKEGKYTFNWSEVPFQKKVSIRWRGLEIHLKLESYKKSGYSDYGGDFVTYPTAGFILNHFNRIHWWGYGHPKIKYGAVETGPHCSPPKILSGNYELKIRTHLNHGRGPYMISLEEVKRNPEKEDGAASTGIEFFETPEGINLEIPETSYRNDTPSIIVNTKEIELYNFRDANVASDVVVQFDKDRLVLNTWRLGSGEDEYYYIVPGDELRKLYAEFQLQEHQKAELLVGLHNAFAGKDCIEKFTKYLDYKKIKYSHQFCL